MAAKSSKTARRKPPRRKPARRASRRPKRREPQTLRLRGVTASLVVADLRRSIAYYTDGLGFVIAEQWDDGGVVQGVTLKAGSARLMLGQDDFKKGRDRDKGVGHRLWFETAQDIDKLAERARAFGIRLDSGPADMSWGARTFALTDPDGFKLTFTRDL
jgi:catechol 2,3-dioxygenase-like lactoylglutathione lyase family enzyme